MRRGSMKRKRGRGRVENKQGVLMMGSVLEALAGEMVFWWKTLTPGLYFQHFKPWRKQGQCAAWN